PCRPRSRRPRRRRRRRGGQPAARPPEAARAGPSAGRRARVALARRAGRRPQSHGDAGAHGADSPAARRAFVGDPSRGARHAARHGHLRPRPPPRSRPQDRGGRAARDRGQPGGDRGLPGGAGVAWALLELHGVPVFYGKRRALEDASLTVGAGEIVALLGATGSGKSTTLRTISGLVRPSRGRIRYEGRDIATWPPDGIVAAGLVHVPEGREIFSEFTVLENLLVGGHTAPSREVASRLE